MLFIPFVRYNRLPDWKMGIKMRRLLLAVIVAAAFCGEARAADAVSAADTAVINKVEARYAEVKTLRARFEQKVYDAATGQTLASRGTVLLKKPRRMLWEYTEPEPQTILADGKNLYFHVPADRQVTVQPLENLLTSRSPALFLAGGTPLRENFRITVVPRPDDSKIDEASLLLEPKERSLTVTRITIRVRREDYTITSFTLDDWTGNRSEVAFTDMEVNVPVADKAFSFTRPKGTEVIEVPKY